MIRLELEIHDRFFYFIRYLCFHISTQHPETLKQIQMNLDEILNEQVHFTDK